MRRKERQKKLKKKKSSVVFLLSLICAILLLGTLFIWIKVSNVSKFNFVNKTPDNGAEIVIVDGDRIIKYKIEPDMMFNSARGLGEYKLSSLWVLGYKEGFKGSLVSESITTNFLIPVYLWKDGKNSNLSLVQKIKVSSLNLNNKDYDKTLLSFEPSNSVRINFIDNYIQETGILTVVDDLTGSPETISKVSSIIDTLGTKVSGYNKGYEKDLDCEVVGNKTEAVKLLSKVFGCKIIQSNESSSDLKIKLGAKFADRF